MGELSICWRIEGLLYAHGEGLQASRGTPHAKLATSQTEPMRIVADCCMLCAIVRRLPTACLQIFVEGHLCILQHVSKAGLCLWLSISPAALSISHAVKTWLRRLRNNSVPLLSCEQPIPTGGCRRKVFLLAWMLGVALSFSAISAKLPGLCCPEQWRRASCCLRHCQGPAVTFDTAESIQGKSRGTAWQLRSTVDAAPASRRGLILPSNVPPCCCLVHNKVSNAHHLRSDQLLCLPGAHHGVAACSSSASK